MKIYTKTGDNGDTSLGGGKRISKYSFRIAAYGDVDELNSQLGVCHSLNKNKFLEQILNILQTNLWQLGADLASPNKEKIGGKMVPRIGSKEVNILENWIDEIDMQLPELRNFIMPGGTLLSAELHVARAVCRRAERAIVNLKNAEKDDVADEILVYMNRLSDLLFMMARFVNFVEGVKEKTF